VAGAFIELPKFDFNLTGMGEFVQLPGLIDAIRSVINTQMANLAVLPNKIVIPLAPSVDVSRLYFPEPDVSFIKTFTNFKKTVICIT